MQNWMKDKTFGFSKSITSDEKPFEKWAQRQMERVDSNKGKKAQKMQSNTRASTGNRDDRSWRVGKEQGRQ